MADYGSESSASLSRTKWLGLTLTATAGSSVFLYASLGPPPTAALPLQPPAAPAPSTALAVPAVVRGGALPPPGTPWLGARLSTTPEVQKLAARYPISPSPPSTPFWRWLSAAAVLIGLWAAVLRSRPPRMLQPGLGPDAADPSGPLRPAHWAAAATAGEEDDETSKAFGYDTVRWLPLMLNDYQPLDGELVLPLFLLDDNAYFPGTNHTLNIIEPRYCEMCSDIILNGSRRFVVPMFQRPVPSHPQMPPQPAKMGDLSIAEVGAVFYIEEFEKGDKRSGGIVKYVCHHKVIGRVRIHRLLNPRALVDRSTYVRAVVTDLKDEEEEGQTVEQELAASSTFRQVIALQGKLKDAELVRFSVSAETPGNLMTPGVDGQFWETASLWQSLLRERLETFKVMRAMAEQELVVQWLKEQGMDLAELVKKNQGRVGIRLEDLPAEVQKKYRRLQAEYEEESQPLAETLAGFSQGLLQEDRHSARLRLLQAAMTQELQRLRARLSLKSALGNV